MVSGLCFYLKEFFINRRATGGCMKISRKATKFAKFLFFLLCVFAPLRETFLYFTGR